MALCFFHLVNIVFSETNWELQLGNWCYIFRIQESTMILMTEAGKWFFRNDQHHCSLLFPVLYCFYHFPCSFSLNIVKCVHRWWYCTLLRANKISFQYKWNHVFDITIIIIWFIDSFSYAIAIQTNPDQSAKNTNANQSIKVIFHFSRSHFPFEVPSRKNHTRSLFQF